MAEVRSPGHLAMMFVSTGRLRQGIGSQLLAQIRKEVLSGGVAELTVSAIPNAIGAYECFGFEKVGDIQESKGIRFIPM